MCTEEQWRFCFIGGLALQRWGEPRETIDVDLTLLTGFGGEDRFVNILLRHFEPRIEDAARCALTHRDWSYIRQQLQPLAELKEAPGILDELERRRLEFER